MNSKTTQNNTDAHGPVNQSVPQFRWRAPIAVSSAVFASGLLYLLLDAFGVFSTTVPTPPLGEPITLVNVISAATFGAVGGVLVYTLLSHLTDAPLKQFRRTAFAVLLLSIVTPFTIPSAPLEMVGGLLVLHATVTLAVTMSLTWQP